LQAPVDMLTKVTERSQFQLLTVMWRLRSPADESLYYVFAYIRPTAVARACG
jgi:hypothetical protein